MRARFRNHFIAINQSHIEILYIVLMLGGQKLFEKEKKRLFLEVEFFCEILKESDSGASF